MAVAEYPTIQGVAPSWADASISIASYAGPTLDTTDFAALKYEHAIERTTTYGTNGGRKRARTRGQYTCGGSMTLYKDGARALRKMLGEAARSLGLTGFGDVGFDVSVTHSVEGSSEIHSLKMEGCVIDGDTGDMAEGADADKCEFTLNVMKVIVDGESLR